MTPPDSRPVLDVIADVLAAPCPHDEASLALAFEWCPECSADREGHYGRVAAAVLAACQGATVEQQAELVGGEVEWWSFYENGEPYSHIKPYRDFVNGSVTPPAQIAQYLRQSGDTAKPRAVGPWCEDPS